MEETAMSSDEKKNTNTPQTKISDAAMARLAQLMNDSPSIIKLHGTEWAITSLKAGTQWLIAEEACKVVQNENATMGDVVKQFAVNMPAICRVLTLALLNDKQKQYAATDAWTCINLYEEIIRLNTSKEYDLVTLEEPKPENIAQNLEIASM